MPKGDVATRTFDVKIRMQNSAGLIEGMEARALVPSAEKREGLKVPRDALIDRVGPECHLAGKGLHGQDGPGAGDRL